MIVEKPMGSMFTSAGSLHITLVEHTEEMNKQPNKLLMFMSTNKYMPFVVKRKSVWTRNYNENAFNRIQALVNHDCYLKCYHLSKLSLCHAVW